MKHGITTAKVTLPSGKTVNAKASTHPGSPYPKMLSGALYGENLHELSDGDEVKIEGVGTFKVDIHPATWLDSKKVNLIMK